MKPWLEKIQFSQPLRDVKWTVASAPAAVSTLRLQEVEQAAFERGRQEGEKALSEQLLRQRRELLELQRGVLESMRQTIPQIARDTETVLVRIAMQVAEKLVTDLPIAPAMVETAIREAVVQVRDSAELEVLLHAEDLDMLRRANSPLLLPEGSSDHVRFSSSPEVTRGGCLVRTKFGVIDARRETKLQLVKEALAL